MSVDVICKTKGFSTFRLGSGAINPESAVISQEKWCIHPRKVVHSGSGVVHSHNCEFSIYFHCKQEIIEF